MYSLTVAQMKQAEANAFGLGIDAHRLMENAGAAVARVIRKRETLSGARCVVLCGKGNNGGDGFVIARKLYESGAQVFVLLWDGLPVTREATEMLTTLRRMEVEICELKMERSRISIELEHADIVVDALYGTGFSGSCSPDLLGLFAQVEQSGAMVYAVDIPSGANGDTGAIGGGCLRADCTVSLGACKVGQSIPPAADYCGEVIAVDIGIPPQAYEGIDCSRFFLDPELCRSFLPRRRKTAHKGDFGRVLSVCGSDRMTGAAVLAATGALRTGAGLVCAASVPGVTDVIAGHLPEATLLPLPAQNGAISVGAVPALREGLRRASVCLLGCGLSVTDSTREIVRRLVTDADCPLVVDADGINILAEHIDIISERSAPLILTPHLGEMSRLTGLTPQQIAADRINVASDFAQKHGVILVLKGANTVIASPDGICRINSTGNPGMAKGGSGDVLAGMIAGLVAQGIDPALAASAGVYLHGLAGDICRERFSEYAFLPTDLLAALPEAFCRILG
ncbi:MAG: NAD(P)H-hydrate dehydratase [Oscillospiraceae bacterium]|nr:NAD(P)H-hydrate dehydratase [Oscillospiraceae bacterium]